MHADNWLHADWICMSHEQMEIAAAIVIVTLCSREDWDRRVQDPPPLHFENAVAKNVSRKFP